ncbi:MAG: sigma 54-interacting transcriptional regulator [Alphaproteobacteria bacterium]|nr:sigma 54-interacting transcriptional regulator [Alphaproteobacteria bacterium]
MVTTNPNALHPEAVAMLPVISAPAAVLTPDHRIVAANAPYRRLYGDDVIGRHCYEVSHHIQVPCDQAGESCPLHNTCNSGEMRRVLHLHHTSEGEEHVDVETYPVQDTDGSIRYIVEVLRHATVASARPGARGLVGRSRAFGRMLELIGRVAPTDATVLLMGETGTGKELVAKALHDASTRRDAPFVPVECSGLTEGLFESELFGHEKGAFTGASAAKYGLVESARGGTLFLDEVGDIPLGMQVKLLRLLETSTFRRVGSVEPRMADFRLICATHRGLKAMVKDGGFREDLYYRINTFPIPLPALRDRRDDLPILIESIWQRVAPERNLRLDEEAQALLANYRFPGNIRELRNILERAALLADGPVVTAEHLPDEVVGGALSRASDEHDIVRLDEAEQRYLRGVIARFTGTRSELAEVLGVSERKLYRKLQALRASA